jgi:predicted dehydrogenase
VASRPVSQNPVSIILVGLGNRGLSHLDLWPRAGGRVVAVVDSDQSRVGVARARGLLACSSLSEALDARPAADVVDICTPPSSHRDLAVAALECGRHVLCEKPFVSSVRDAELVVDAARSAGRRLAVMHNWLYEPALRRVLEASKQGKLGRVIGAHLTCTDDHRRDTNGIRDPRHWVHSLRGGRIEETLPHLVYTLVAALDDPSLSVRSACTERATSYPWVAADTLAATLTGERTIGTIWLTYAGGKSRLSLDITGTENEAAATVNMGIAEFTGSRHTGKRYREPLERALLNSRAALTRAQVIFDMAKRTLTRDWPNAEVSLMRQFLASTRSEAPDPVTPEDIIATVRITNELLDVLLGAESPYSA